MDTKEKLRCPVCEASDVRVSHRRGVLERGPLTWLGILPFRCGQCQTRFYKVALKDPRRHGSAGNTISRVDLPREPRWNANLPVVVTVHQSGQVSAPLNGIAENASLNGARLRLPTALPEGSLVSVALEGGLSRLGNVCWTLAQAESEILHGVRFQASLDRGGVHSRPFRRLRRRQQIRRSLIALIGLAVLAVAAYGLSWWLEQFGAYSPKYYEPKDIERQWYEQQRRQEKPKGPSGP